MDSPSQNSNMDVPTLHLPDDDETADEISSRRIENATMSPSSNTAEGDERVREDTASDVNSKRRDHLGVVGVLKNLVIRIDKYSITK